MFCQVLSALFSLMEQYESTWKSVRSSEPVETFGFQGTLEPEPVNVNLEGMIERFKTGYRQFSALWRDVFSETSFEEIRKAAEMDAGEFHLPTDAWVKMLYELTATFHLWSLNRVKLLETMTPLYLARVASFVRQSWEMTSEDAEGLVEEQAERFEQQKDYLIGVWDEKSAEKAKADA